MVNLHNSCNEGVDASDDLLLSTGYEPKASDFNETSVEPYMQLLDSPPLFSDKVSSADPDYDDATLEDMLHQAHRAQAYHSLREDLSVSLSSSSMSDRTVRPVRDRSGQPGEHQSSEAQIRTLLDDQKEQLLAECQARISQHEFHAARAEEEQRVLQGQLLQQKLEFREAHQRSLTETEGFRKFQSSTFDTMARRKFVEDQNTILELSGRVQELPNEIHCMNDSRDFMTKDTGEQFYAMACREYTLPRDDGSSQPRGWIQGNSRIGPVLEVTTSCLYGKHGVEIRIWSLSEDNTHSLVGIYHGSNKFVMDSNNNDTEVPEDQPEEQALQLNVKDFAYRSKAKAKPQRREPAGYSPSIIPMKVRNWIDIEPGITLSLCVRSFEESSPSSSSFSTSTTRRGWSGSFLEN